MSILYSMVARGTVVLAEFSAATTNANATARQLLERKAGGGTGNNDHDSNMSYSHDRYIFHVKKTDGLTVVCMADDSAGRTNSLSLPLSSRKLRIYNIFFNRQK